MMEAVASTEDVAVNARSLSAIQRGSVHTMESYKAEELSLSAPLEPKTKPTLHASWKKVVEQMHRPPTHATEAFDAS